MIYIYIMYLDTCLFNTIYVYSRLTHLHYLFKCRCTYTNIKYDRRCLYMYTYASIYMYLYNIYFIYIYTYTSKGSLVKYSNKSIQILFNKYLNKVFEILSQCIMTYLTTILQRIMCFGFNFGHFKNKIYFFFSINYTQ